MYGLAVNRTISLSGRLSNIDEISMYRIELTFTASFPRLFETNIIR